MAGQDLIAGSESGNTPVILQSFAQQKIQDRAFHDASTLRRRTEFQGAIKCEKKNDCVIQKGQPG